MLNKIKNKIVENKEQFLIQKHRYDSILQDLMHRISLSNIEGKHYNFIKNYIKQHQDQFIAKFKELRDVITLPFYRFQLNDENVAQIFSTKFTSYFFSKTTGDGSCLYNAI